MLSKSAWSVLSGGWGLNPRGDQYLRDTATSGRQALSLPALIAGIALIILLNILLPLAPDLGKAAQPCPNEPLRTGPSASLPDCRAYELITPADLGRTQDMTFNGEDHATPSADGEHVALRTIAEIEPDLGTSPSPDGTHAVFSRTPQGWTMRSVVDPGSDSANYVQMDLFSPDLSQVGLDTFAYLNNLERSPDKTFEVGPVGGPYTVVAKVPLREATGAPISAEFVGANAGTASVPAFSDVLLDSSDHGLASSASERAVAEGAGTVAETKDVYEWSGGQLRLVNVTSEGALTSPCGAVLGDGIAELGPGAINAVSEDGSKIFFTSPQSGGNSGSCGGELPRLYMRVDGKETVEVSKPQGVTVEPSERKPVEYIGATPDGSKVFFTTETRITKETAAQEAEEEAAKKNGQASYPNMKLFMYDTVTGKLTLAAFGVKGGNDGNRKFFVISGDGSTVYYQTPPASDATEKLYRYETGRETGPGNPVFVARSGEPAHSAEPMYTTRNGEFLTFASSEVTDAEYPNGEPLGEPGAGYTELYRYDSADGRVRCVSCGEGAPAKGVVYSEFGVVYDKGPFGLADEIPGLVPMSEDGRRVFFETSAQLVRQDTNSTKHESAKKSGNLGLDVYEWEGFGVGDGRGVVCGVVVGCTFLLSSGEGVGPEAFLGASKDGRDIFFTSAAQLLPQATPEFTNIYDARIDGGFPQPAAKPECTSCQGVGSPPPLFSVPASVAFQGSGNPAAAAAHSSPPRPPVKRAVRCPRGKRLSRGRCVRVKVRGKARARKSSHDRGARW